MILLPVDSGGPPEVPIPLLVVKIGVCFLVEKDELQSTVVGVQFVVGTEVFHAQ